MRLPEVLTPKRAATLILLITTGVLGVFLALAVFAFPSADDFCYAVKARELGFVGAQREWYLTWSGRYAASGLLSAFALAGGLDRYYGLAPVLVLLSTAAAFCALVLALAGGIFPRRFLVAGALALCVIFLAGLPDVAQVIYWVSGSFTYQLGNVSLLLLLALGAQRELGGRSGPVVTMLRAAAGAGLTLVAAGSNEVTMVCLLALLAGAAVLTSVLGRESRWFWALLLLVAVAGALASVLAPGNARRAAGVAADGMIRPPLGLALVLYPPWTALRLAYWLANPAIWASAFLLLILTRDNARAVLWRSGSYRVRWLLVPACWLGLLFAVNGLGFAVNRYPLPERAESVVYLMFLLGWYPSFIVLYHRYFPDRVPPLSSFAVRWAVALLALGLLGAPNVFEGFKDVYRGYRYRREMMDRVALIRAAKDGKRAGVEVPSLSRPPRTLFATELTTDTTNFRNDCPARYYGLRWIRLGAGSAE